MNQLQIMNRDGKFVVDSREVSEMTGKEHAHLMRDIRSYEEIIDNDPNPNLDSANFFIKATYFDKQNQERPCYLLTKIGCDMVANKMTGEKGVLFTAAYVTKFDEMEKQKLLYKPKMTSVGEVASLIKTLKSTMKEQKSAPHEIAEMQKMICEQFNIKLPEKFVNKPKYVQLEIPMQIGILSMTSFRD